MELDLTTPLGAGKNGAIEWALVLTDQNGGRSETHHLTGPFPWRASAPQNSPLWATLLDRNTRWAVEIALERAISFLRA